MNIAGNPCPLWCIWLKANQLPMPTLERPATKSTGLCKIERPSEGLPQGAVLADSLKTLETQLARRGFLRQHSADSFNPLWYLAETERNVFLWKRGLSVIQQDEFEFWVDLEALIQKRLEQLSSFDRQNPFLNPLWGVSTLDQESLCREREYLLSFRVALAKIELHLHALSCVGSMLLSRQLNERKERVVLPVLPTR